MSSGPIARLIDSTHPTRLVLLGFGGLIALGTTLLALPIASREDSIGPLKALFTATSAVCVTGLTVVDTQTQFTGFGKVVILLLIQVGGFGIMTMGSLLAMLVSRQLGLRQQLFTHTERAASGLGDMKRVVRWVGLTTLVVESTAAVALALRLWSTKELAVADSVVHGVFHSVSAFNNAGFSLYSDSLSRFSNDGWILGIIGITVIIGGLGFPVLIDLWDRRLNPRRWSLHTQMTLAATAALLVSGTALIAWFEWTNPHTLGSLGTPSKLLNSWFHSVMPRTAGFNSLDVGSMNETTQFATIPMMVIGGGSASTAGGMKVSTFTALGFAIWAELKGNKDINAFGRRVPSKFIRQALAVALGAIGLCVASALALMAIEGIALTPALFEVASAFGTVGLSTGITPELGRLADLLLVTLMFIGRVGPLTFGTAIVATNSTQRYRFPKEGMIIG